MSCFTSVLSFVSCGLVSSNREYPMETPVEQEEVEQEETDLDDFGFVCYIEQSRLAGFLFRERNVWMDSLNVKYHQLETYREKFFHEALLDLRQLEEEYGSEYTTLNITKLRLLAEKDRFALENSLNEISNLVNTSYNEQYQEIAAYMAKKKAEGLTEEWLSYMDKNSEDHFLKFFSISRDFCKESNLSLSLAVSHMEEFLKKLGEPA